MNDYLVVFSQYVEEIRDNSKDLSRNQKQTVFTQAHHKNRKQHFDPNLPVKKRAFITIPGKKCEVDWFLVFIILHIVVQA